MEFSNLPKTAVIREVCSRDGFQGIKEFIPTETKIEFIEMMIGAGIREMEITSFVSPRAIPQLVDAADVLSTVKGRHPEVTYTALTGNAKGAQRAIDAGADMVNFVFSASESHNKANMNRTVAQSLEALDEVLSITKGKAGVTVSIATSFMCPFEGRINPKRVAELVRIVRGKGVGHICLAETIGTCVPNDFVETLKVIKPEVEGIPTYLHIHDTFGMALLNVKAALDEGFNRFDSAVGGLGGCPFAPGAAGNAATEDLVFFLNRIGVDTGLDPIALVRIARALKDYGLRTMGHLCASTFGRETVCC